MYRQPGRVEDTVVTYVSRAVVWERIVLGVGLVFLGIVFLFSVRPRHLTCERSSGAATCTLARVGVVTTTRTMALAEITELELRRDFGAKHGLRTQARLHLRSSEDLLLDVEEGQSEAAMTLASDKVAFDAFVANPGRPSYDAWFGRTNAKVGGFGLGALLLLALGGHALWEQIRQTRAIRIVVDHAHRRVRLAGGVVAFEEVAEVRVEEGRMYFLKGKKERVDGQRLVVVRTDGRIVAAARRFDRGGGHDAAKTQLLDALGRITAPHAG